MAAVKQEKINEAAAMLRALAHPLRLKILSFIDKNKVINVNKIYNTLKLEQSITSQHLRILRNVDLVNTRREGKFIFYSVNYDRVKHVHEVVNSFIATNE